MAHKAMAGGEIGANGEFYKGGQFVADDPKTVKGEKKWFFESREDVSVWGHAHNYWTEFTEFGNDGKVTAREFAVGNYGETVKPDEFRFYGYLLALYLDDRYVRLTKQEIVNLYFVCYPQYRNERGWFVPSGKTTAECATITEAEIPAFVEKIDAVILAHKIRTTEAVMLEREAARKAAIVSKHIGTEGEKMELDVEMTASIPFESEYGGGTVYKFKDAEGNELVWMTSAGLKTGKNDLGCDTYAHVGDKLRIKFTVKGHDTYCDVPQTKIYRVKAVA